MAAALTHQFVELLRFLKVDRGVHSNGRLLWRCDVCGFETCGVGIHSHRKKHCREYGYLIDRENDRLRLEFEEKLAPYSQAIAAVTEDARFITKIEMKNYADRTKVIALLEETEVPRSFWLHVISQLQRNFSNRAYSEFISELAEFPGVVQLVQPHYLSKTYEDILAAVNRSKDEQK